jgi:hypothetical protein
MQVLGSERQTKGGSLGVQRRTLPPRAARDEAERRLRAGEVHDKGDDGADEGNKSGESQREESDEREEPGKRGGAAVQQVPGKQQVRM